MNFNQISIIGTPIRIYRRRRCCDCGKCYEYNIENIPDKLNLHNKIKLICPWCNAEIETTEPFYPLYDDRSVRCD